MATSFTSYAHKATTWSIVLSVLIIVVGVLAICAPVIAGVAVTAVIGSLLVLSGILHLAFAWHGGRAGTILWEILLGIVYGAIGFYLLTSPVAGLAPLTFAIALYLVVEAILEFVLSFRLRPAPGSGWLLADGIITLTLAVLIWGTWPSSALWVPGTLVGISMLFSGITRMMLSLAVRRIVA